MFLKILPDSTANCLQLSQSALFTRYKGRRETQELSRCWNKEKTRRSRRNALLKWNPIVDLTALCPGNCSKYSFCAEDGSGRKIMPICLIWFAYKWREIQWSYKSELRCLKVQREREFLTIHFILCLPPAYDSAADWLCENCGVVICFSAVNYFYLVLYSTTFDGILKNQKFGLI